MSDEFYRVFEDKYRGSRELIKSRLQAYVPFVEPLLEKYKSGSAVDLGCGRGEWLEVLGQSGLNPVGVDVDRGMLQACWALQLNAVQGDAFEYLKSLEDDSQVVVSAFHVVEHVAFEQLIEMVKQAVRVLKPGGLLILETPNPENIVVATRDFYLDPTHQCPIPSALLEFVAEYAGFERVKVVRLQESKEVSGREHISLTDVLNGVSPDYAIIAQKGGDDDVLRLLDDLFVKNYGLSLDVLVGRYDARLEGMFSKAEQAAVDIEQLYQQLHAVYNSTSWRVTAPLRWLGSVLRKLK